MKLNEIYGPIGKELNELEKELNNLFTYFEMPSVNEMMDYFFESSGKHLRPALAMLSAGAVSKPTHDDVDEKLVKLALVLELIHSASLVHDDIIDKDMMRRGKTTLNNVFGNKLAVLAGDALFSRAYEITSNLFPMDFGKAISDLSVKMCIAEIEQAKGNLSRESYFKVIEGKTALFMSVSCKLGAMLAGADESQIGQFERYGLNLGMAYQIKDDYMDDDPNALKHVTMDDAWTFAEEAKAAIGDIEDNVYKHNLYGLIDNVMTA